jgi:DNA-binding transcriptional regulator YiaG
MPDAAHEAPLGGRERGELRGRHEGAEISVAFYFLQQLHCNPVWDIPSRDIRWSAMEDRPVSPEYRLRSPEYRAMVERLKQARQEAGLKQEEVAAQLGKPQSYVSKVERAERRIDPPELARFAEVLGKPVNWFLS